MRVVFFGSYDAARHPRVRVLKEGLAEHGDDVFECNHPLGLDTRARLQILRRPWRVLPFLYRVLRVWWRLGRDATRLPRPDAVVVGYMGHLDVHLARRLWPGIPIVLDHLIFAADTAIDRRIEGKLRLRMLNHLDRAAVEAADVPIVDTDGHLAMLSASARERALVVPVGSPSAWFRPPGPVPSERMRVLFFGLFTPLQGTEVIGEAIAMLAGSPVDFTMVGTGQDYERARAAAATNRRVAWIDWLDADELREQAFRHHVCLGIFGSGEKARRVVPNKVYQGAAAGCAVITSDTEPQRAAFGSTVTYVPAGDAAALAHALGRLCRDPESLHRLRVQAFRRASERFSPAAVTLELRSRLAADRRPQADDRKPTIPVPGL